MARRKLERVSDVLKAESRLAGIRSISETLDLGNGVTAVAYTQVVNDTKKAISDYNKLLSSVDDAYNKAIVGIDKIKDWNERVLIGVANKYTKNSSEYEMAGGTRKSERKKPSPKKKVEGNS